MKYFDVIFHVCTFHRNTVFFLWNIFDVIKHHFRWTVISVLVVYDHKNLLFLSIGLTKGHRPLSLKVPCIEFELDVKFSTLLQPCKQYIKILRWITHLHAIIRPHWNFRCICHNLHHWITYIEVEFDVRYFQW